MEASSTTVSRLDLATLQHDLEGPLATFGGFLAELQGAVDTLERLGDNVDAASVEVLLEDDFRPCLLCLNDSLSRLRATIARLAPDEAEQAA